MTAATIESAAQTEAPTHPNAPKNGATSKLPSSRFPRVALIGVGIVFLVGLTAVPVSFMGDQALFSLGAHAIAQGHLLYRDFWDDKQPGIYVFFRTAGALTGFGNVGVHVLELVWQLALAMLIVFQMRGRVRANWVLAAAPVFAVGTYYAVAGTQELTQVEALVGLPLLGAIALTLRAVRRPTARDTTWCMVGAGLCAFVVAYFKMLLVATPVACCALIIGSAYRQANQPSHGLLWRRSVIPFLAGIVVPSIAFIGWAASRGLMGELWQTWFVFPQGMPARSGRSLSTLSSSLKQLVKLTAPLLVLAVIGIERARTRHRDLLAQSMVVWLATGLVLFLVQLWWFYLLMFFMVPIGVFAAYGLDTLWANRRRVSTATAVGVVILLVLSSAFAAKHLGTRVKQLAQHGFAIGAKNSAAFRAANNPAYARTVHDAQYLHQFPKTTSVDVWGDPLYLYVSDRSYAISVPGWAPEMMDARLWNRAAQESAAVRPKVVFVDTFSAPYIETRGKALEHVLQTDYHLAATTDQGKWYVLNG
jgi:hypothetical protein